MRRHHRALLLPWAVADATMVYTNKVKALSPLAYWPQAELTGTTTTDETGNGRSGTYVNTPTLGQTGIGDGRTAPLYTAASSQYANVFSASLAAALNGAEGTFSIWMKAPDWVTGTTLIKLGVNASNDIYLQKNNTNDRIEAFYVAGGTTVAASETSGQTTTAWRHVAMTWSKSADQMKLYINGTQAGTTQTGLGVFTGSFASNRCCIAAADTIVPTGPWNGNLAHAAVWASALSAAQITTLATVP